MGKKKAKGYVGLHKCACGTQVAYGTDPYGKRVVIEPGYRVYRVVFPEDGIRVEPMPSDGEVSHTIYLVQHECRK